MSANGPRWVPLTVLVVALAVLIGSIAWVSGPAGRWNDGPAGPRAGTMAGPGMTGGQGMMHSRGAMGGPGMMRDFQDAEPISDIDGAAAAAERYAQRWGLQVGEVMRFSNDYYAELLDATGHGATEVLIDPATGAVHLEWGPAMMWNTEYGMRQRGRSAEPRIDEDNARRLADEWLEQHQPGLRAGDAHAFPGYYTLHTEDDEGIAGMLSVHARTGAIWYHTWHGAFLAAR